MISRPNPINDPQDYNKTLELLRERFAQIKPPYFTTDAAGLFEAYVSAFPPEQRQYHTCTACRRFIEAYGGLVAINEDGLTVPLMWDDDYVIGEYFDPIAKLEKIVRGAKVTGVFYTNAEQWGTPVTGEWTHFAMKPVKGAASNYENAMLTPEQAMAEKKQNYLQILTALKEFSPAVLEQAITVLKADALTRADKFLKPAEWLLSIHEARKQSQNNRVRDNVTWRAIATAPNGFCHPRSSMIGTLLDDIAAGLSFETINRNWTAKMHPLQYQRPQVAPSAGNLAQAEKIVAQLGIANSLRRRFARLEEVRTIWKPQPPAKPESTGGVFGHLRPKGESPLVNNLQLPPQVMTWAKFSAQVLPEAVSLEVQVPVIGNFSALVTAVDPDSPPILQWDKPEDRYPVSSYVYHGGSPASRWGLDPRSNRTVTGISPAPQPNGSVNGAVVLILEGAKDAPVNKAGLGIFPETLKGELHAIRSTIEAYSKAGVLEGRDDASACGLAISPGAAAVVLYVTTKGGSKLTYKIDRWD